MNDTLMLTEICKQPEFSVLVAVDDGLVGHLCSRIQFAEDFPGSWYAGFPRSVSPDEICQHAETEPYKELYRFDSPYDYAAAVEQGVVQDYTFLAEDADAICAIAARCMVLRMTADAEDAVASEFAALVWHGIQVCIPQFPPFALFTLLIIHLQEGHRLAQFLTHLLNQSTLALAFEPPQIDSSGKHGKNAPADTMFWS